MNRIMGFRRASRPWPPPCREGGVRRICTSPGAGPVRTRRCAAAMTRPGHGAFRRAAALLLAAACAAASATGGDAPGSPVVIDPATFAPMPAGRSSARVSRSMDGLLGPRIALLSPGHGAVYRVGESLALHAEFLPAADGAAPDMETLSVRVRHGLRGQDVTGLVKPYVQGTVLRVPLDLSGHAGELRLEMDILDARGRMGVAALRVAFKIELRDALLRDGGT